MSNTNNGELLPIKSYDEIQVGDLLYYRGYSEFPSDTTRPSYEVLSITDGKAFVRSYAGDVYSYPLNDLSWGPPVSWMRYPQYLQYDPTQQADQEDDV